MKAPKGKRSASSLGKDGVSLVGSDIPPEALGADALPPPPAPGGKPKKPREPFDPVEVEGWLTGQDVTALGVTPRALSRWTESGVVARAKDGAGQWRFKPDDIEAARTRSKDSAGTKDEVLDSFRSIVGMLTQHLERSFTLVHEPGQRLLELLEKENKRLASRCDQLEGRHLQMLDLYEKLMTAQHVRDLQADVSQKREARRDRAFTKLTDAAPAFFQQVLSGLSAKRLVESIDDGQIEALLGIEFLNPEQRRLVQLEKERRAKAAAEAAKKAQEQTAATAEEAK